MTEPEYEADKASETAKTDMSQPQADSTDGDAVAQGVLQEHRHEPIFNLPTSILVSLALIIALYVLEYYLVSDETGGWIVETFGFIPYRYELVPHVHGLSWLWSPVTYSLLHGSADHLLFNGLWLAAFGTPVARRIGALRFVVLWVLSAIASAALFGLLHRGEFTVLVGASGVISALMGAACRFAFPLPGRGFAGALSYLNPRLGIFECFGSRTVTTFTIMWLIGNGLTAMGMMGIVSAGSVAWEAHIGGFLFGFLLFSLFDRPPTFGV